MNYLTFNDYMKNKYGTKVYKLSLSCGKTCPNRDGTKSTGGCIFCAEGSGTFAQSSSLPIKDQIVSAKKLVSEKMKNVSSPKYIAYFQSYTGTYLPLSQLKEVLYSVLYEEDIVEIRLATRPDCLEDEKIDLLSEINKTKPISVELGLQTSNNDTAQLINRCYDSSVFTAAVEKLQKHNINSIAHIIIGLPKPTGDGIIMETKNDILNSVSFAVKSGISGIKLQLLHVLRGTKLENLFHEEKLQALSIEEYADILSSCIEIIPGEIVIERITGDPPKSLLVEPQWASDKKRVMNYLQKYFREHNIVQGSKYEKN